MQRVTLEKTGLSPNFIGSWTIEPPSICDDLISYFELNQEKQVKGVTVGGINLDTKNSIDIGMMPNEINLPGNEAIQNYFQSLFSCYKDYALQWPFLDTFAQNLEVGTFNLQRYQSGQHFNKMHTERSSIDTLHRVFAWMTYLNDVDVEDGGSTYFSHYDLQVQPKKGLTLIWPAEWTHAHKGNLLQANSKYIITGWMHLLK
jgi:prolyl 4-hydroxylase